METSRHKEILHGEMGKQECCCTGKSSVGTGHPWAVWNERRYTMGGKVYSVAIIENTFIVSLFTLFSCVVWNAWRTLSYWHVFSHFNLSHCRQIPLFNQLYTMILWEAPFPLILKPLQLSDLCASAGVSLEEPLLQLSSWFTHGPVLRSLGACLVSGLPDLAFYYPVLSGIC